MRRGGTSSESPGVRRSLIHRCGGTGDGDAARLRRSARVATSASPPRNDAAAGRGKRQTAQRNDNRPLASLGGSCRAATDEGRSAKRNDGAPAP